MQSYLKKWFIVLIIPCVLVSGCGTATPKPPISISISSLKESYPVLIDEAQKWDSDVYLADAKINLYPNVKHHAISASFYSHLRDKHSITIYLTWDGVITSEVFSYKNSVYHHKPIELDDWKIDSQEALEYVDDSIIRKKINNEGVLCSSIHLERHLPLKDEPLVWALSVSDCANYYDLLYIDPNTGETLTFPSTQPTRFPSKTP